jgi:hypothetical protein
MYGSRQFGGAQDAPRPETQALGLVPMVIEHQRPRRACL